MEREVKVVQDCGDDVILELPIGAVPRGEFNGLDKKGAETFKPKYPMQVLSIDKLISAGEYQDVELVTVEKECSCNEVKAGAYSAIVSSNESLAVFDVETGGIKKTAPEGSEGLFIPVIRKDPHVGTIGDRDIGWWIGMLVSDGWVQARTVGFTKLEDRKREEFIRIAREKIHENFTCRTYYGEKGENKLGDSCKVHLNGKDLAGVVSTWGFYKEGKGALHKQIPPEFLYNGSEECLLGILAGLLDGDGSLSKNMATGKPRFTCRVSTSSKYLVESLKTLMFRLGIRWSLTVSPPRGHSKEAYTFCPSTVDIRTKLSQLSFVGIHETGLSTEWQNSAEHRDLAPVPITNDEFHELSQGFLAEKQMTAYTALRGKVCKGCKGCKRHVSRTFVSQYKEVIENYAPDLLSRANTNLLWEPIKEVTDAGIRKVYDLEVPSTKVFAVNGGMVVWDTASYSVPISDAAVKEAVTKMMTDKNLKSARDDKPHYLPSQEYLQGLYLSTKEPTNKPVQTFATKTEALKAYRKGTLRVDDPIVIKAP